MSKQTVTPIIAAFQSMESQSEISQKLVHDEIDAGVTANDISVLVALIALANKYAPRFARFMPVYIAYVVDGATWNQKTQVLSRTAKVETLTFAEDIVTSAVWFQSLPKADSEAKPLDLVTLLARIVAKGKKDGATFKSPDHVEQLRKINNLVLELSMEKPATAAMDSTTLALVG